MQSKNNYAQCPANGNSRYKEIIPEWCNTKQAQHFLSLH